MSTPTHCSFAEFGTYGHECGSSATLVGTKKCTETKNGIYYARRCAVCASKRHGENIGVSGFVPFDPAIHVNLWR